MRSKRSFANIVGAIMLAAVLGFALVFSALMVPTTTSAQKDEVVATSLAPTATFPADAPTLGAIPEPATGCGNYTAAPRDVTFQVSGVSGTITDVRLSTTFSPAHTWRGDLSLELRAPGGAPAKTIFRQTGSTTAAGCGSSAVAAGPYNFFDTAAPATSWWLTATTPTPSGNYKASTPGGVVGGGADTPITPTFAGLGAAANGTWTLRILDGGGGDTGAISAASLTITTAAATDANVDINGDGKTDFVVGRGTATPLTEGDSATMGEIVNRPRSDMEEREVKGRRQAAPDNALAPPIWWYTYINGTGTTSVQQWGDAATDFFTPEDFDGDGKDDLAVWRPGAAQSAGMGFYVLQSATSTLKYDNFGQTGDDPAIVGDYDGDNKADPAVYRCPAFGSGDGQCFFFYRGSNANPGGNVTYVPWGFGEDGDFFVNPGDFDGDGKYDFCIQRSNPAAPTSGQFVLLKSNGFGVEFINWGSSSDFILPGDYDGDGRSDFCVRRTVSGSRRHFILERDGGGTDPNVGIAWGITGDVSAPGDYDGDGKQDLAVWRPNADPTQNFFYVLRSSDAAITQFEWGQQNDVPAASWYVH